MLQSRYQRPAGRLGRQGSVSGAGARGGTRLWVVDVPDEMEVEVPVPVGKLVGKETDVAACAKVRQVRPCELSLGWM